MPRTKKAAKPAKDLHQIITDRIVASLEKGVAPWVKPWKQGRAPEGGIWPINGISRKAYSGINVLILWSEAQEKGYTSNVWYTHNQASKIGAQVRGGEKGTMAVYVGKGVIWHPKKCPKCGREGIKIVKRDGYDFTANCGCTFKAPSYSTLKYFYLFNADQIDNLPARKAEKPLPEPERHAAIDAFIETLEVGVDVQPSARAFYTPMTGRVTMPMPNQFKNMNAYYNVLLHETGHWTGHSARMDRDLHNRFGTPGYAFEELIAELFAAFRCAHFGIEGELQHAEYIGSWIKRLKDDKQEIFRAASAAQAAIEYCQFITAENVDAFDDDESDDEEMEVAA